MIRRLEKVLIALGFLDSSQEKWERTAGIWLFSALAIGAIFLVVVIFDELLLDQRFNSILRPIGLLVFLSFFAGAGYWGVNARKHDPRSGDTLGWRGWAFILILLGIACAHVFIYISAST